ncbi:hypothetical protein [Hymenobacter properus]|uniref:Uncharacterized protein n=1 Tax=Hymenobacter properus TaxID=2791026 RepID=A0A931BGR5_9BACT|nr:hypothetical protein [Hymenobacter properus]MBF9143239.1 hypothetical protein [Hymenobacter properus]MBR7722049.1 hypothetical protein [Microvirga sp. SRT04]
MSSGVLLGPTHLQGHTIPVEALQAVEPFEWRRKLQGATGNAWFRLKYAGQRHHKHTSLLVGTNSPVVVVAVDVETQEEILLFDGSQHGHEALFGDTYAPPSDREAWAFYQDPDGEGTFGVVLSAYYQIDYEDEEEGYLNEVDHQGNLALTDGRRMPFAEAQRNGFDCFQIAVTNRLGRTTEVVSEELA